MQNKVNTALAERRANKTADADLQELFGIETSKQAAKVVFIPISQLTDYPDQPFKPFTAERLAELAESIQEHGLLNPVRVRRMGNNQYQILAGHNRKSACMLLGWTEIQAVIENCDDDTAKLIMLTSNLCQRQKLLPSEKAFAYKMQMDILRRQGKRTDLEPGETSTRIVYKLSAEKLAEAEGTSREDIRRHIRLTLLIPELLEAVDKEWMPFTSGVDFSSLAEENQRVVLAWLKNNGFVVSVKQSERICKMANDVDLTLGALCQMFASASASLAPVQTFSVNRKKWKEYDNLLPRDSAGFDELFRQFLDWLRVNQKVACKNGGGGVE